MSRIAVLNVVVAAAIIVILVAVWLGRPEPPEAPAIGSPEASQQATEPPPSDGAGTAAETEEDQTVPAAETTPEPEPSPAPAKTGADASDAQPPAMAGQGSDWVCTAWSSGDDADTTAAGRTCLQWTLK